MALWSCFFAFVNMAHSCNFPTVTVAVTCLTLATCSTGISGQLRKWTCSVVWSGFCWSSNIVLLSFPVVYNSLWKRLWTSRQTTGWHECISTWSICFFYSWLIDVYMFVRCLYILTIMCNIDNNTTVFQYFGEVVADSSWFPQAYRI